MCGQHALTYAELDARSNALAHAGRERGVARGDRVVMFADNTVETVVASGRVLKANAVVSIVNPLTKARQARLSAQRLPRRGADHRRALYAGVRRAGRGMPVALAAR